MGRLARFVLHHRRLVLLAWAVILIASLATTQKTVDRLSFDFSLPGQPGHETSVQVNQIYGNGGEQQPSILVLTNKDGTPLPQAAVTATFTKVGTAVPQARIVDFANTRDPSFVVANGSVQYALAFTPIPHSFSSPESKQLERALIANAPPGTTAAITGLGELSTNGQNNGPGVLLETMLGALGALAVLAFVFASFLALVPLAIAAVSILSTFLILLGVTYITDVSFIVQFLVSLIGLGVAIDYSLLVVTRWREERAHGLDNNAAVVASMRTAGQGRRLQRCHRRDRLGRTHRAAGAVPALDRFRRHAHPAGERHRLAHVAAGDPGRHRATSGLAADSPGRRGEPQLDALGDLDRAPALVGGGPRHGRARHLDHPGVQHQDRAGQLGVAGEERPSL